MNRGLFSFITSNDFYKKLDKKWVITLDKYHKFWFDLIVNYKQLGDDINTKDLIVNKLRNIEEEVRSHLDKRFIYFICSRKKVRFNLKKKPWTNPLTKYTYIHLLIGRDRIKKRIKVKFIDANSSKSPKIKLNEKFIFIFYENGNTETVPIHEFLDLAKINLGICSNVEYVGYTNEPSRRPTNKSHAGLADILYKISNEDNDFLIYFNTFCVRAMQIESALGINIVAENGLINEINADKEGKIIEKCFISYFDSNLQDNNKKSEEGSLKNNLFMLKSEFNISKIDVYYNQINETDYTLFSSNSVRAMNEHYFSVSLIDDNVVIKRNIKPLISNE
ncbi:hypothetical protein [Conservatibacter flavescens]|uniref:Uncharacterized protein n=1 Tax=Conservatibacter flavescens TaxID=28161 RepID=A0A2M8RZN2_9PAST|nr:hypothetical protein [Conservatibacter flavescens]PJG84345.1 hypothetical protein CVP05_11765 [Conservatibacter flavescens]